MPKPFPLEFRRDVIAVARHGHGWSGLRRGAGRHPQVRYLVITERLSRRFGHAFGFAGHCRSFGHCVSV